MLDLSGQIMNELCNYCKQICYLFEGTFGNSFRSVLRVKQLNEYVDYLEKKQNGEQTNSKFWMFHYTIYWQCSKLHVEKNSGCPYGKRRTT